MFIWSVVLFQIYESMLPVFQIQFLWVQVLALKKVEQGNNVVMVCNYRCSLDLVLMDFLELGCVFWFI